MNISQNRLRKARISFHADANGIHYAGLFPALPMRILLHEVHGGGKIPRKLRGKWGQIWEKSNDLFWIIHRIEANKTGITDDDIYREYTGLDIQLWHSVLRSLLDHVASLIQEISLKNGQSSDSFTSLRSDCLNPLKRVKLRSALGSRIHSYLCQMQWYDEFVSVRDNIIHHAAKTLVFPDRSTGTLFQIYKRGLRPTIQMPRQFMYNSNVAYFEHYSATLVSEFLLLLDFLARATAARHKLRKDNSGGVTSHHPGYGVFLEWSRAVP